MSVELPVLAQFGLEPKLPPSYDHQVTGTFGECERMAYYMHILGRQSVHQQGFNLVWGSCFHECTEVWELTKDPHEVAEVINSYIPEEVEDRYGRNRYRMMELFIAWVNFRANNPIVTLRSEQPVLVTCNSGDHCPYYPDRENGCGLTYGGRIDRVVEWQGMKGPLDFKTTVMDEQDPMLDYRPNHQFLGYVWDVSHLMAEHNWGIIVERLVCNKSKIDVKRYPVSFSRDLVRAWVDNEHALQGRLEYLFHHHGWDENMWVQNYARCSKPYMCQFRDVCLAPRDGGFRYKLLRDNYTERRWDFTNPTDNAESRTS